MNNLQNISLKLQKSNFSVKTSFNKYLCEYKKRESIIKLINYIKMWKINTASMRPTRSSEYSERVELLRIMRMLQMPSQEPENNDKNDPCKKYLGTEELIKKDGYGLEKKIKKFKRIILDKLPHATDLMVYKSRAYPIIFIKYTQKMRLPKYKHLRQIFKDCPNMRDKRELIDSIFQRLYSKVERGYFNISSFALAKANEIKVKMQKGDIFNLEQGKEVMFYFVKNEDDKTVKFTLFDKSMRSIQFDSQFIQQKKNQHPEDYKLYEKFIKNVFQQQKEFELNDIFDNQELESDEQTCEQQKMNIYEVRTKLNEILRKDLSQMEHDMQNIEEQINQVGDNKETIKILTQKKNDIEQNIRNFINTKVQVEKQLRRQLSNKTYEKCLKKMIIAEKQLESKLPIVAKKRQIFELLKKQNFIIIQGQTGSGKSTQLPQILCQFYNLLEDPLVKPVLVTQPRRLAARSLAERVASEMGEKVGRFVDYVASAGKQASQQAKIIFKLDRLVLDEITQDPLLSNYSCLVIDEAHERTISIDVILGLVKQLLISRKDFKVIVTSASMDIPLFQRYFGSKTFKVSGRNYPITITYKDYEKFKEGDKFQMVHKIKKIINQEILHDNCTMKSQFKGHLLCFCSSVEEINELVRFYTQKLNRNVFSVYALHGKISPKDQKKIFQEAGKHKFIFASRIAETAITIDGVRVVIDPGQDIELIYDQKYKVSSMKLKDISQSSAKQRAGRSGRTGPGHCFRIYSEESFKKRKLNKVPQIQNSSLETAVLRLKTIKIKDVINFPYISKPDEQCLRNSLSLLQLIGALKDESSNYEPTEIGKLLVKMPIEPFLGRAIIQSMIFKEVFEKQKQKLTLSKYQLQQIQEFGIIETTIQILSLLLNFSNLFIIDKSQKHKGQQAKYTEFSDQDGDFFFLMNIFNKYKDLKQAEKKSNKVMSKYYRNSSNISKWIQKNFLNIRALVEADKLAQQITFVAQKFFIHEKLLQNEIARVKQKLYACQSFKQIILSSLITSFCSNLCKFSGNSQIGYTMVTQKRPIRIYGTSNLQLLGINADWIICFDLYTNDVGRLFCKVAHQVTYDFLKKHVNVYVWNKYEIQTIQKSNPFYQEIPYDLPTKILQQIRYDFQMTQNNEKLIFLRDLFPIFNENKNRISFFFIFDQKSKVNSISEKRQQLNQYMMSLKDKVQLSYEHNFVGSIFVNFEDGLVIDNITFKHYQFCVQVVSITIIIEHFVKVCADYGKFTVIDLTSNQMYKYRKNYPNLDYQFQKLRFIPQCEDDKRQFLQYVDEIMNSYKQIPIQLRIVPLSQQSKASQSKVYIYFYAGKCIESNNIFLKYDTRNDHSLAFKMLDMLKEGVAKKTRRTLLTGQFDNRKFITQKMKPSKKKNGINLFDHPFDQFQLIAQLQKMVKDRNLPQDFIFPRSVTKFRDPVLSQAIKSDSEWRQEIYSLLDKIGIKKQSLIVNITGFHSGKKNRFGESTYPGNIRVTMTAQIFSIDNSNLDQIKTSIQGKKVLGCDKVHIKNYYDQIIALVSKYVFDSLEEEYYQLTKKYKVTYPQMHLIINQKKVRNQQKILIIARSENKSDSSKIQKEVMKLFTPKILKLDAFQYRFLNQLDNGQSMLEEIEQEYSYKIYFSFEKYNKCIKLYCKDHETKLIQFELKARIKQSRYRTEIISYRGKNLNVVKGILQKYTENKRREVVMVYEIKFQSREISITADLDTFESIKWEISKLADSSKGQCEICADSMQNPYKFLNCNCSFCWQCIVEHIRSFRNSMEKVLLCPREDCKTPINVNDIKTIMPQEQFQSVCNLKIKQYLDANQEKYYSCNVCQHIIDRKQAQKDGEINCEVCGRSQCLKCRQSHQGYTCRSWLELNNLTSRLPQFGIKICKKCGEGIQKNGGCNHMTCTRCQAHICWKCEAIFSTKKECQDHLVDKHKAIFDDDTRE